MRNAAILILCILWTLGAFAQPVVVLSFDALAADTGGLLAYLNEGGQLRPSAQGPAPRASSNP